MAVVSRHAGANADALFDPVFAQLPLPAFLVDPDLRIAMVNADFERRLGYPAARLHGRSAALFHHRDELPRLISLLGRMRRADLADDEADWRLVSGEGDALCARVRLRAIDVDGGRFTLGLILQLGAPPDGDRGDAEGELHRRLERQARSMEQFFEFAPVGFVLRDSARRVLRVNRAFTAMSGFTSDELVGRADALMPAGDAQAREALEQKWLEAEHGQGAIGRARVPLVTRDGRRLLTDRVSTVIESADGERMHLTAVTDITQEHTLEEELKRLVLQQGALLRTMASGVMMVVRDRAIRCNASLEALLGLPAERIIGRQVAQVLQADRGWEALCTEAAPALAAGSTYGTEVELRRAGQDPVVCALQLRLVDPSRPEIGRIVTLHDITQLKRQQSHLLQANAELSALVENTAVAIAYLDRERIVRCNRMMEALLGRPPGELAGRALRDFLIDGDSVGADLLDALADPGCGARTVGVRLLGAGGVPVPCLVHLGPVDPERWPSASILVAIDMSGQQAALSALAETQERFGRFAEAIDEAVFVIDAERRRALYANAHFEKVLGTSAEAFFRNPDAAWTRVDPQDRPALDALLAESLGPGQHEADVHVERPDGSRRVVRLRFFAARLGSSELYGLAEDVTEIRSLAQRRIDEAIEQRDTLVREVHHRIKNNLQGVAGLLKQSAARRPEIAPQLEEIVGQIQAIAQVHGLQVRERGDLSLARLARAVFDNLSRSFGHPIEYDAATFEALERWSVPEQEAVPVALVVNELGTNAIKHRVGAAGVRASIELRDGALVIGIRNDGRLPEGFSLDRLPPSPSGLGLIKALLPRRGAKLSLRDDAGAVQADVQLAAPVVRLGAAG